MNEKEFLEKWTSKLEFKGVSAYNKLLFEFIKDTRSLIENSQKNVSKSGS